jgi:hypothetical protein
MKQPPEYVDSFAPLHVCKVDKALCGLKQAPRAWFSRLSAKLVHPGFMISKSDTSLFIYSRSGVIIYLLVYVDDIIITSSSATAVTALLQDLRSDFTLKDLGEQHYFLGIQASRSADGLVLSQEKYASEILKKVGMHGCKPVRTPLVMSQKLW